MSSEKAFRRSQAAATAGGSGDGVPRPPRYLRHSVILSKKSASICEIHPPQYCPSSAMLLWRTGYGGRVCGSNPVFKIKNPSQNAQKLLKVNKGQLSLVDTPRGVCQSTCQNRPQKNAKAFIFNGIIRFLTVKIMSYFTPKKPRFMNGFRQRQFVNIIQRFCVCSCQPLRPHFFLFPLAFLIHSLPRRSATKKGQPSVGLAKEGQLTRLSTAQLRIPALRLSPIL